MNVMKGTNTLSSAQNDLERQAGTLDCKFADVSICPCTFFIPDNYLPAVNGMLFGGIRLPCM
jgi:hypothetical protein